MALGDPSACSIAGTLEIIGDRWTILILRDAFRGVRRFEEIQQDLGIARNVLTDRLAKLVANGVLEKRQYQDRPARYEYRLTAKGVDLSPALVALMRWGDKHLAGEHAPTVLVHEVCGTPLDQTFICWDCDTTVEPAAIRSRPGNPGPERPSERKTGPERPSERKTGPERPSERTTRRQPRAS